MVVLNRKKVNSNKIKGMWQCGTRDIELEMLALPWYYWCYYSRRNYYIHFINCA